MYRILRSEEIEKNKGKDAKKVDGISTVCLHASASQPNGRSGRCCTHVFGVYRRIGCYTIRRVTVIAIVIPVSRKTLQIPCFFAFHQTQMKY